jgi:biotin operon repressor
MSQGWIKLHRELNEWEWYTEPNMVQFFLHCLIKANHSEKKWRGVTVKEGQFISGRKALSSETGLTERAVRTCINKLEKTGELTTTATNKYTLFELNSWKKYQIEPKSDQQDDQQATKERPANDQQSTTNKNEKNKKNEKNEKKPLENALSLWDSISWTKPRVFRSAKTKASVSKKVEARVKSFGPDLLEQWREALEPLKRANSESWFTFEWAFSSDSNMEKLLNGNYSYLQAKMVRRQEPKNLGEATMMYYDGVWDIANGCFIKGKEFVEEVV